MRIRRLDEALTILDGLMRGQTVDFEGEFYTINGLQGTPRPRQGPRPPIAVGGGGPGCWRWPPSTHNIISVATGTTAESEAAAVGHDDGRRSNGSTGSGRPPVTGSARSS